MHWQQVLFSFEGRISRRTYWIYNILFPIGLFLLIFVCSFLSRALEALSIIVIIAGYGLAIGGFLALSIKRLHDRDKGAVWLLLFNGPALLLSLFSIQPSVLQGLAPAEIQTLSFWIASPFEIWGLIELGFRRGTVGGNRFGSDPLEAVR